MKRNYFLLFFFALLFLTSCSQESTSEWTIPSDEIFDGGPGKDGIPSVDSPNFASSLAINYMNDDDLIIGFKNGSTIKGYTHPVLDWHEIVNDVVGNVSLAITYCPLTGTAIGWDRTIDGEQTTFGVSGLLYNSNLIPYDRKTDSNWSQMQLDCVNGALKGRTIQTHQLIETTWATWKKLFPDAEVITTETGISRNYGTYPYFNSTGEDYRIEDWLLFGVDPLDKRLAAKERVLGVLQGNAKRVYQFKHFESAPIVIVEDDLGTIPLVIAGSKEQNFLVAFERTLADQTTLQFTPLEEEGAVIMEDNEGNKWNIFGEATEGPRTGQQLKSVNSFMGYWFAWGAFYPGIEIYEE